MPPKSNMKDSAFHFFSFYAVSLRRKDKRSGYNTQSVRLKATAFAFFCLIFILHAGVAQANTFNVGNGDVAGLKAAINAANASPAPNTINLTNGGTYILTTIDNGNNGLPAITNSMTINGNGATIQRSSAAGTPDFRFFLVVTNGTVTFSDLTLSNGGGTGTATSSMTGGAILNPNNIGTVNVVHCRLIGNHGNYGGALNNVAGTLNVIESTISGNATVPPIDDTCCGGGGGGILNYQGTLNVVRSTISGNSASSGGGIHSSGVTNVTNSTISDNSVSDNGGGGGILSSGTLNVTDSTIAGNSASNGGGIFQTADGTLSLHNSIIALNTASNGRHDLSGAATSLGSNIIGNITGATIAAQTGDQFGVTAAQLKLGPLSNNGGPTQTMALNPGSIAIDAGDDCVAEDPGCLATPLTTDQRGPGFPRKSGAHVDAGAVEGIADSVAPITTATRSVEPNAAGWNNGNVTVTLNSADDPGGMGVKEITYSASGAQTIPTSTVPGNAASIPLTAEGQTTITYFATDTAGNGETPQTITVRIDKTTPIISCAAADGNWHAIDVSIPCTSGDTLSGLSDSADGSFSLSTSVHAGIETANAATDSHTVCDNAGNCATAGPIGGNKVDKKAPTVTISAPVSGIYLLNQSVAASYTCADGGSGVTTCSGTAPSGSNINTAAIGAHTFTVNATDSVGNSAVPVVVNYTVSYAVRILFDQTKAAKSGSVIPVKVQLTNASGANVSSPGVTLHAVSVTQTGSSASPALDDAGASNPDFDFRYDSLLGGTGGYVFNLKTTGYGTGSYLLSFTVGGDPTLHPVQFQVRQ